jgi:hypothetical protein
VVRFRLELDKAAEELALPVPTCLPYLGWPYGSAVTPFGVLGFKLPVRNPVRKCRISWATLMTIWNLNNQ